MILIFASMIKFFLHYAVHFIYNKNVMARAATSKIVLKDVFIETMLYVCFGRLQFSLFDWKIKNKAKFEPYKLHGRRGCSC